MKKAKILVAISASLILAGGVSAFVLIGGGIKWENTPREILVRNVGGHSSVDDPDGGVTQVVNAINAEWDNAGAGNLISTVLDPSPPLVIGDGISVMGFEVGGSGCSGGCLGITLIPPTGPGGELFNGVNFSYINDADIFFNPNAKFYSDLEANGCRREYHIETVGVHEAGHLLGLDHTPVTSAVMFASSSFCNPLSLHQDDIDGINCIYTNGASCGACVPDTLIVDQTNCSQPSSGPNAGDFVVETFIVDNCGGDVGGADVTIDVPTSPLGPLTCSGQTASNGRLGCALDNPPDGLYETLVDSVSKAGSTWPGTECGGVGQPPCGCSIEIGGCVPTSNKEKGPRCSDGIDNDCDGLIDGDDPDC